MSDREKLIELVDGAMNLCINTKCSECIYIDEVTDKDPLYSRNCQNTLFADHLISNGVTVQKWIPVSERLPTEEDADEYETVYAISKGSYPKQWHWTKVAELHDHFTHWMPLPPEPPKECE